MFWIGIILTLVGGVLANNLLREYVKKLFPQITAKHFDIFLIIFLLIGLGITIGLHLSSQKEIKTLKKKAGLWKLSTRQKYILKDELSAMVPQPIFIASRLMDGESCNFAEDLASVFGKAGWDPGEINKTSLNDFKGIRIFSTFNSEGKVENEIGTNYKSLLKLLRDVGIEIGEGLIRDKSISNVAPSKICLVIGRRPD